MKTILLLFSIYSYSTLAETQIAILDTGFCPEKITLSKSIKILAPKDLTNSINQEYCKKINLQSPRFHGQLVLLKFLDELKSSTEKFIITPLIIFDHKGQQKKEYWEKALGEKFEFFIAAAGLPIADNQNLKLNDSVWFVSAPRLAPGIKKESVLFPAEVAPLENLFLIGNYIDGGSILFDEAQLYQDKIDYFFPSGTNSQDTLKGTSRAVAIAAARALNICKKELKKSLRSCLKKKSFKVSGMQSF
jgi:hypothetical protein